MKGLYKKQNGWWYYRPVKAKDQPRPKTFALGTKDELEALTRAREKEAGHFLVTAEMSGTMKEVLPHYLEEKSENTRKTRRAREFVLNAFADITGNPKVREIDAIMIREWRRKLASTGGTLTTEKAVSPSTMTGYLIILKAFLNWCVEKRMIRENPAKSLKGQTVVRVTRSQGFLTRQQRDVLISKPCKDYVAMILHLGFFAGLRDGEMLAFNPDWLWMAEDRQSGSITVQDTAITFTDGTTGWWRAKGKDARTIPMHPRLLEFIKNYGMRRPYMIAPDKPLWPVEQKNSKRFDAKRALRNHGKKYGIPNLAFHILRHSFGTHLSMSGMPMNEIAALLGNTLRVTERHYIGFSPSRMNVLDGL